jgi:hypothetical protein
VSDLHLHILNLVAHRNQRELNHHDAVNHVGDAASAARRQDLERTATRTRARVAAAQARRRYHPPTARPDGRDRLPVSILKIIIYSPS